MGIIGNFAGALAQWKGFFRANKQVIVRGQGFMRVSPQVKWEYGQKGNPKNPIWLPLRIPLENLRQRWQILEGQKGYTWTQKQLLRPEWMLKNTLKMARRFL